MKWDAVMQVVVDELRSDSALVVALGGQRVARMVDRDEVVPPAVRWTLIADTEQEVMNPLLVQLDYWATSMASAATIERRIRRVLSRRVRRTVGGIEMATLFEDARDMPDPGVGVVHRSLDFRFEPVRER